MPAQIHKVVGFSSKAFITRSNALFFKGQMNFEQRRCLLGFYGVHLFRTRIFGVEIPRSWLAYSLATTFHETAATMKPIREFGKGKGKPYGKVDPQTHQTYYGRGYVQLTWRDNYQIAQQALFDFPTMEVGTVPLVEEADLAMKPFYAAQILMRGMADGWFTKKKLSDYLTAAKTDYVSARKIINGLDKADWIAGYARDFEAAIQLAQGEEMPRSVIQNGSAGVDVRELQLVLNLQPDGHFCDSTKFALMKFQTDNDLLDDGICGHETWNKINRQIYNL